MEERKLSELIRINKISMLVLICWLCKNDVFFITSHPHTNNERKRKLIISNWGIWFCTTIQAIAQNW